MTDRRMREIREHFSQEGYRRLFEQVHRKFESIGRVGGHIRLERVNEEERKRITGLLWEARQPDGAVLVKLTDLDQMLRDSRWGIGLEELTPLITGKPLLTKKQRKAQKESAWDSFYKGLREGCSRQETASWWENVWMGKAAGAKAVRMLFDQNREHAMTVAGLCLRALDELPCWQGGVERLPVFANRLSGDPHALDAETLSGRWLYQALCELFGVSVESTSEWKREVLQEAGILTDDLASYVMLIGIGTTANDPWYDFFERATEMRMPLLLPLAFFQNKVAWRKIEHVYVVENPSVFQSLIDRFPRERKVPPLVCVSGQPSVAALRLLDALTSTGARISYSGDFDWKGLEIACSLQKRYGESYSAWRMGVEDYRSCSAEILFEEEHLRGLLGLEVVWDQNLVKVMEQRKAKVFQESLLEGLLVDFICNC